MVSAAALLLLPAVHLRAENGPGAPVFKARRNLVLIPATVVDRNGRPFTGLQAKDFLVSEEGRRRRISHFWLERSPVSLGILMDVSGSMAHALGHVRTALTRTLETLTPGDEAMLIGFRDRPHLAAGFCSEPDRIRFAAGAEHPGGGTALWDALLFALHEMKRASNPARAIILFSDGVDRNSRHSWRQARHAVREAGVPVYAFLLPPWTGEGRLDLHRMCDLAEESGGCCFKAGRPEQLRAYAERLDVRWRYVIGFSPSETGQPGQFLRTRLELTGPHLRSNLRISWRRGYFAPVD